MDVGAGGGGGGVGAGAGVVCAATAAVAGGGGVCGAGCQYVCPCGGRGGVAATLAAEAVTGALDDEALGAGTAADAVLTARVDVGGAVGWATEAGGAGCAVP